MSEEIGDKGEVMREVSEKKGETGEMTAQLGVSGAEMLRWRFAPENKGGTMGELRPKVKQLAACPKTCREKTATRLSTSLLRFSVETLNLLSVCLIPTSESPLCPHTDEPLWTAVH